MCLLLVGPSNKVRAQLLNTVGLLADIYSHNPDGLGAMYATPEGLRVNKILPKVVDGARDLVLSLPDDQTQVALHFRWRTHGDIDLENCHPYKIKDGAWLMHNGVLRQGNAADKTKSDTWHFAKDYLADMAHDAMHDPAVVRMLGEFIGNNRFAIASADGRMTVVNRDDGVEHDGVWYSNTYAWTPSMLIPSYVDEDLFYTSWRTTYGVPRGGYSSYSSGIKTVGLAPVQTGHQLASRIEHYLGDYEETELENLFRSKDGNAAIDYIVDNYDITLYSRYNSKDYDRSTNKAVRAWTTSNVGRLKKIGTVALTQALLFCCNAVLKTGGTEPDDEAIDVKAVEIGERDSDAADLQDLREDLERQYAQMTLGYEEAGAAV